MTPDPDRVASLAAHLVKKGVHPSLAERAANDILVFYPGGGTIQTDGKTIVVTPKHPRAL